MDVIPGLGQLRLLVVNLKLAPVWTPVWSPAVASLSIDPQPQAKAATHTQHHCLPVMFVMNWCTQSCVKQSQCARVCQLQLSNDDSKMSSAGEKLKHHCRTRPGLLQAVCIHKFGQFVSSKLVYLWGFEHFGKSFQLQVNTHSKHEKAKARSIKAGSEPSKGDRM